MKTKEQIIEILKEYFSEIDLFRDPDIIPNLACRIDDVYQAKSKEEAEHIKELEAYIKFLDEELNETATLAYIHGWRSKRFKEGNQRRERLAAFGKEGEG